MSGRQLAVPVVLVLTLGLFVVWLVSRPEPSPPSDLAANPTPTLVATAPAPAVDAGIAAPPTSIAAADSADSARTPAAAPTAPPIDAAVISGRCTDERGAPLAGCNARLSRSTRTGNGINLAETTDADGRFELAVEPNTDTCWLLVEIAGRVGRCGCWNGLAANARIDVGTFVMAPGILVRGRVVDTENRPVSGSLLQLYHGKPDEQPRYVPGQILWQNARTGADGIFEAAGALPEGPLTIAVHGDQRPREPVTGVLTLQRPVEFVTIVVPTFDSTEWITGKVVDQRGNPVANAWVKADGSPGGVTTVTGKLGGFRLRRPVDRDKTATVELTVTHEDHPTLKGPVVAWGTADVVLQVADGDTLVLQVRDPEGRPVGDYKVWVAKDWKRKRFGTYQGKFASGPFADGVATLRNVQRDPCVVMIEFGPAAPHPPLLLPLDLVPGVTRVDVVAEPLVERWLEVVDGAGKPVVGTVVLLVDPVDGEFLPATEVVERPSSLTGGLTKQALQLQVAATDASGRALLRGPGTRELAVRLPGPGHEPIQCGGVSLAVREPLRLEVQVGAQLFGTVGPAAAVEFLRGLAGDAAAQLRNPLRLQLARSPEEAGKVPPVTVPLRGDGSFDYAGLTPGTYWVSLQHPQPDQELLGKVTLSAGQKTRFDPEIPVALMTPGTATGEVRKNGESLAGATVWFEGTCNAALGTTRTCSASAPTDSQGRYQVRLRPGHYRASLRLGALGVWTSPPLHPPETVTVYANQAVEQHFTVAVGTLRIEVRTASGAPAPAITVFDDATDLARSVMLPPTDAGGSASIELAAQRIALRTLPKSLQEAQARTELWLRTGGTGLQPHWIPLGEAEIRAGATTTVELRLPVDWDR